MSKENGYCIVSVAPVRADKKDQSEIVTQLLFGELISIIELDFPWAKITTFADGYHGWIDFKHIKLLSKKETKRWLNGLGYSRARERMIRTPWGIQSIYRGSFVPENMKKFEIGTDHFEWITDDKTPNQSVLSFNFVFKLFLSSIKIIILLFNNSSLTLDFAIISFNSLNFICILLRKCYPLFIDAIKKLNY